MIILQNIIIIFAINDNLIVVLIKSVKQFIEYEA